MDLMGFAERKKRGFREKGGFIIDRNFKIMIKLETRDG